MDKITDVKLKFIARDKETGHLRFESRAMTWEEATEFIHKRVLVETDWFWNMEVIS